MVTLPATLLSHNPSVWMEERDFAPACSTDGTRILWLEGRKEKWKEKVVGIGMWKTKSETIWLEPWFLSLCHFNFNFQIHKIICCLTVSLTSIIELHKQAEDSLPF